MSERYTWALSQINQRSAATAGYIGNPVLDDTMLHRGLARTRALLDDLSAPDEHFGAVHIAGSKGKGSTATYLANILTDAGCRTGLSTSPHLHSFRERMTIDGKPISPEQFGSIAGHVLEAASRVERARPELGQVSAFEVLVAMSLRYFADEGCDFAVVEVGLGGRYDNTNVIVPNVSVITALELEHTSILGPTIQDIAWNKGGIIKPGVPVVASLQGAEATAVLLDIAESQGSQLLMGGRDWRRQGASNDFTFSNSRTSIDCLAIQMPGEHQVENAATAVAAVLQLSGQGLPPDASAIRSGLRRTALPGRFEVVEFEGHQVVLDGAHTPSSVRSLAAALLETGIVDPVVVAGFLRDKDISTLIATLASLSSRLVLTPVENPRSATFEDLSAIANAIASESATVFPAIEQAWPAALESTMPHCPIVITGSMTVVGRVRDLLGLSGNS